MSTDHLAAFKERSSEDLEHHGVPGMRWGVRRSSSALKAAAASRGGSSTKKAKTEEKPAAGGSSSTVKKPAGNIQDHVESSSDRYARLAAQAREGRASDMTEQDLKFFNARTDALAKINKMNEQQPSWLRETTTKVIQQSAQRQMQGLADAVADKYIGDPIKQALKGAVADAATKSTAQAAAKVEAEAPTKPTTSIKEAAAKAVASTKTATPPKAVETSTSTKPDPKKMQFSEALDYFKNNPSETPEVPPGYSAQAQKIFMDEITRHRGS